MKGYFTYFSSLTICQTEKNVKRIFWKI